MGGILDEAKNLATILSFLDFRWGKLNTELSEEELSHLELELAGLRDKIKETDNFDEVNDLSKNFIQRFSELEHLEFLANIQKNQIRSGGLPSPEEEIKIKIINYCVLIQNKIDELKGEKQ